MSTYWRLYCLDCDDDSAGFSLNHGDDTLLAMLDVAPLLAPLADPQQHQAVWDYGLVINCQQVPLEWIWSHQGQGHRVGVRSEYGEVREHGNEQPEQPTDEARAQSS